MITSFPSLSFSPSSCLFLLPFLPSFFLEWEGQIPEACTCVLLLENVTLLRVEELDFANLGKVEIMTENAEIK